MFEQVWYCGILPLILLFLSLRAFTSGQRKYLFWRAGARCEECNADWHDGIMLEAHHIKPLHDGGSEDESNGIMLCRKDHANAHEDLAHKANKRGDRRSANANAYSARQIRKRSKWREGHEPEQHQPRLF